MISIIFVPSLLFISYSLISQYERSREEVVTDLIQTAERFSAEQGQTIEAARQLLVGLAVTDSVRNMDPAVCDRYLGELIQGYRRYANFGVANSRGEVICSSVPGYQAVNVADREFFRQAYNNKGFAVGEYEVGKITNKPVINFGYPIVDAEGNITGVVFSSLDLSWVGEFVSQNGIGPDGVFLLLDQKGKILARNPEYSQWIGKDFPSDSLIKEVISENSGVVEADGADGRRRLYAFKKLSGAEKFETTVVVGLPSDQIFRAAKTSLLVSFAVLALTMGLVVFISWKIGGLVIIKQMRDLEELDRQKTEFVSVASHQLRTPISGMKMLLEILLSRDIGGLNKKQLEVATHINGANERMIGLVNQLLDVSKIELGKFEVVFEGIFLREMIDDVVEGFAQKIAEKNISMEISIKKDLMVYVDQRLVIQALANLVDNSIKYSFENGVVKIKALRRGGFVFVRIKNDGVRLRKVEREKIFSKFERGAGASVQGVEGSGLGLFIAKNFIELSGGTIEFAGVRRGGATVIVKVPYYKRRLGVGGVVILK